MNTVSCNPEDFFNNLFDDRMYTILTEETNKYARQQIMKVMGNRDPLQHMDHYSYQKHTRLGSWKDLNSSDIKICIALLLVMSSIQNLLSTTIGIQLHSQEHHFLYSTLVEINFKIYVMPAIIVGGRLLLNKTIDLSEGKLETKLYCKPTDTMELLHTESYHPEHTFKGIVKSQIIRFHCICSTNADFEDACTQLFKALVPRGYTSSMLRQIKKDTLQQINNPASKTKGPNKLFMEYLHEPTAEFKISKCGSRCETCLIMETGSSFTSTNTGKQ